MALTATTTYLGARDWLVTVTGTTVGVAEEVTLTGLPAKCRLVRHQAYASGGTVTDIETFLTRGGVYDGDAVQFRAGVLPTVPRTIDEQPNPPVTLRPVLPSPGASFGELVYRPTPDTADGDLSAKFFIRAGWE